MSVSPDEQPRQQHLKILQYNVRRSRTGIMADLMASPRITDFDIICIQEPFNNPYTKETTFHPLKQHFRLVYPANTTSNELGGDNAGVCTFINKSIPASSISATQAGPNLISVHISQEAAPPLSVHNVYNPPPAGPYHAPPMDMVPRRSPLIHLREAVEKRPDNEHVVVGDFNLHHQAWSSADGLSPLPRSMAYHAPALAAMLWEDFMPACNLRLCTAPGAPTHRNSRLNATFEWSTIDLTMATPNICERLISCKTDHDLDCGSDHMPIATTIQADIHRPDPEPRRNLKNIDADKFLREVSRWLPLRHLPHLDTQQGIEDAVQLITTAIQRAVDSAAPLAKPCAFSKPGWTKECSEVRREARTLRRRWQASGREEDKADYVAAERLKKNTIMRALRDNHRDRVAQADSMEKVFKLSKWARTRGIPQPSLTPPLRGADGTLRDTAEDKAEALQHHFFPKPPEADLSDINGTDYPEPTPCPPLEEHEILTAIAGTKADNAPGPDGFTNRLLKLASGSLTPLLTDIFNACLRLQHCPSHFKDSITVTIRKPGKDDYQAPKSYRPIALLNTLGKLMDVVIAKRLSAAAEIHGLLPDTHFGGRTARSTEHALHLVYETIHAALQRGDTASLLLLDQTGAFDNVSHRRLLHNLRKRRIHPSIIGWLSSYLTQRTSRIKLAEGTQAPFTISTGIPQGSPLSPILFIYYNSDLLDIAAGRLNISITGYIDDTSILVTGPSTPENNAVLAGLYRDAEIWSKRHSAVFSPTKYQLIHFTHLTGRGERRRALEQQREEALRLPLIDGGEQVVRPQQAARHLGVVLDSNMKGLSHLEHVKTSTAAYLGALRSLTGSTWGITTLWLRRLVTAVLLPKVLYGCSLWFVPDGGLGYRGPESTCIKALRQVQKEALRVVSGAFRRTAGCALDIEMHTIPIELRLRKAIIGTWLRLRSSPTWRLIENARIQGTDTRGALRSPLQKIEHSLKKTGLWSSRQPPIEDRCAEIVDPWWQPPDIFVAPSKEEAIANYHAKTRSMPPRHVAVFTDGSEIDGQVGAAAICPARRQSQQSYLGTSDTTGIYAAELQGIYLAMALFVNLHRPPNAGSACPSGPTHIHIFCDNQAAVKAVRNPRRQAAQFLLRRITTITMHLRHHGVSVSLNWLPGHRDIPGNEAADRLAKEAAQRKICPIQNPRTLLASVKRRLDAQLATEWQSMWELAAKPFARLAPTPDAKRPVSLFKGLTRAATSLAVQLRSGKIGLNAFLHPLKLATTPFCPCGHRYETAQHLVETCPIHAELRKDIFGIHTDPTVPRIPLPSWSTLISEPKWLRKAITFMKLTERLKQFRSAKVHIIGEG